MQFADGTSFEVGPQEVFDIPAGHNGWVVGDEPVVQIEWAGIAPSLDSRRASTAVSW